MHVKSPQWPAPAEELLQAIPLAPKGMSDFFLSAAENARLKAMKKVSRKSKNKSVHRISDAPATLKTAESLLNNANSKAAFHKLQLPLLLVTGRRFAEIMNGRSKFTPIEDQPLPCSLYRGQLKRKRGDESEMEDSDNEDNGYDWEDDSTYQIPLLVPFDTFEKGWKALREKQEIQNKKHGGVATNKLTNKQVSKKYQKNLNIETLYLFPNYQKLFRATNLADSRYTIYTQRMQSMWKRCLHHLTHIHFWSCKF